MPRMLRELKGVGEKTEKLFQKLNITTVEDLLRYYPRDYDAYEPPVPIESLKEGQSAAILGTITGSVHIGQVRNLSVVTVQAGDATGKINLVWYNMSFLRNTLKRGSVFVFRGKLVVKKGRRQLEHPEIFTPAAYEEVLHSLQPIYSLTAGITNKTITKLV